MSETASGTNLGRRAFRLAIDLPWRSEMPAKSQAQQKAAGAALAAKRGETPKSSLKGASKEMVDSMSESELEDMASTKRKGKLQRAAKKKKKKK
jgi:hypothetical protein